MLQVHVAAAKPQYKKNYIHYMLKLIVLGGPELSKM